MVCDTLVVVDVTQSKRCRKCGVVKPVDAFSTDPRASGGRDGRCRECRAEAGRARIARRRADRFPDVLGVTTAEEMSAALYGALMRHYDGRPTLLAEDLVRAMRDARPELRLRAAMTAKAIDGPADLARAIRLRSAALGEQLDALPDADWQAIVDRQTARRGPETKQPR